MAPYVLRKKPTEENAQSPPYFQHRWGLHTPRRPRVSLSSGQVLSASGAWTSFPSHLATEKGVWRLSREEEESQKLREAGSASGVSHLLLCSPQKLQHDGLRSLPETRQWSIRQVWGGPATRRPALPCTASGLWRWSSPDLELQPRRLSGHPWAGTPTRPRPRGSTTRPLGRFTRSAPTALPAAERHRTRPVTLSLVTPSCTGLGLKPAHALGGAEPVALSGPQPKCQYQKDWPIMRHI